MNKSSKQNVFIFHGTGGYPEENWFPWLKVELEKEGSQVFVPQFPDPREGSELSDWLEVLKEYEQHINEESILIGHSLGGVFLLRVLEKLQNPIFAAFFVASPIGVRPIKNYESDEKFSGFIFNWSEIKNKAKHFAAYYSDNDPFVSLGNGKELARQLGIELRVVPKAGHFNKASGYTKFKQLLEDLKKLLY